MKSIIDALLGWGAKTGLDQPHRQAQFLAQVLHESGAFRYDREVWGPTPAQQRDDTRTNLGNTKARDGDGVLFRGRTAIQITGRANTEDFRDWCRKIVAGKVPDFERHPDAMLTDPWEGLGPIWYWDTRRLNRYADQGDVEMVTKRINGGLNGYQDRLDWLAKVEGIEARLEHADESRSVIHQRLDQLVIRTTHVEADLVALKNKVGEVEDVTDDIKMLRQRALGAGTLGVWLWRVVSWLVSAAAGAAAAYTWFTGRPPP